MHILLKSTGLLIILMLMAPLGTADAYRLPVDLTELSIEALANVEVSLASRKPQKLSGSAAAIFVITQDDIRRSGVTSIPEALRMVPGLEVARINSNEWAITSRGFNGIFANKLLVLMDGRSVYSPLFSGVYWGQQDTMIEDIERIEVVRGPGATMWGANAVNGVINIITKNSQQTMGGLTTAGGGSEERFGSFRYGSRAGDVFYRVYGKYHNQGPFVTESGDNAHDSWEASRFGFRIDSPFSEANQLTFQGDFGHNHFENEEYGVLLTPPYTRSLKGGSTDTVNLLGRWHHTYSSSSDLSLQIYYDYRHDRVPTNREIRNTCDFDLQHTFAIGGRNDVVWGLGYRRTEGDFKGDFSYIFEPSTRRDDLFSGFLQDDILLIPERLHLILGSKLEHNDYTGFEIQPSIRSIWTPDPRHTVWGSVSRAVRTPAWGEINGHAVASVAPPSAESGFLPVAITFSGDRDFISEKLIAYELGYRTYPTDRLSLDIAAFYNIYSDLRSARLGEAYLSMTPVPHMVIPMTGENRMRGKTYGAEVALDWKPLPWWRLQGSYTYLHVNLHVESGSIMAVETPDGGSPQHQFSLRSNLDISETLEFDSWFRYAGRIRSLNVPSYLTLDLHLGWKPIPILEVSVVGQNLLHKRHKEFGATDLQSGGIEIPRAFYTKLTWRF